MTTYVRSWAFMQISTQCVTLAYLPRLSLIFPYIRACFGLHYNIYQAAPTHEHASTYTLHNISIYPTVNGQSHRTIATTWPYNILRYWYGRYWTVVIAQLSAVDLPCKAKDKRRWSRKASEWCAGSFRLIVCKQNTSVNILFIINNIITYALRIVLIN